jgi:hypothetical protein
MDTKTIDTNKMTQILEINKIKRLIRIGIDANHHNSNKLPDNIIFNNNNMKHQYAYTNISTQRSDDITYGIVDAGKSITNNNVYLYRYMSSDKNDLNYNIYFVEINKLTHKVIKIKYINNGYFPQELAKIRKIMSWENNYLIPDITGIICGTFRDEEMTEYNVDCARSFNINTFNEGFLSSSCNKINR